MSSDLFDRIATFYDQDVSECDKLNQFPYAGYDNLLSIIAQTVQSSTQSQKPRILDLGIGTAQLYQKINPDQIDLTAMDYSEKMIEIAKLRVPDAKFIRRNIYDGFPEEEQKNRFDYIISTFVWHHFDLSEWINLMHYYLHFLSSFGKLIIGDILFEHDRDKQYCYQKYHKQWDDAEYYHTFEDILSELKDHFQVSFMKTSYCTGIIIIENIHDCTLQFEENLVEYKRNTMKWKSTESRKKRE